MVTIVDSLRMASCAFFFLFSLLLWTTVVQGSESILIIRSDGQIFEETSESLKNEIAESFAIREMIINETTTVDVVEHTISKVSPKLVVLINNAAVKLYRQFCETLPDETEPIPSFSLMGVQIEKAIDGLKNAGGISYEIPLVTSATNLRTILGLPIRRIGVIYREFMSGFIGQNRQYCLAEEIDLVERFISKDEKNYKEILEKNLKELLQKEKVEAIWIVNDNVFLKADIIKDVWIPLLNKHKKPAIVGVESLIQPEISLGTFAVLPDNKALGIQAAEMIYITSENGWKMNKTVVPPLSVLKIVNMKLLTENFKGRSFMLLNIDKVLQ